MDDESRWISWGRLRRRAEQLLAEYGVQVDPNTRARDLAVEQRQFVEIARALSFGARLIILDEPTAQLDARGIGRLFDKLRELQSQEWRSCSSPIICRRCTTCAPPSPSTATHATF
ncbi:ATP-binding cassette domain-containing protein [Streptomyces yanii]|uniref:ATP-binding cassette domain-containing protein n=1 Tax=Streptomyces yanii TaxID=78510 RepID=UPI0031EE5C00